MPEIKVDLYSDTSTKPSQGMREFMCAAEVGDEQKGEDPSVNMLQEMVATMLGKQAALLLPSGTMCNQIAFAVHCGAGDLILLDRTAHPLISEAGGAAVLARATMYPIDGEKGQFTVEQMAAVMESPTRYKPRFRLVSLSGRRAATLALLYSRNALILQRVYSIIHQEAMPTSGKWVAYALPGFLTLWFFVALIHVVDVDVNGVAGLAAPNVLFSVTVIASVLFLPALLSLSTFRRWGVRGYVLTLLSAAGGIGLLIALAGSKATTAAGWLMSIVGVTLICIVTLAIATVPGLLYLHQHRRCRQIQG